MGISQEELKQAYENGILEANAYQAQITDQVKHLLNETSEVDLKDWRKHGDEKGKEEVENLIGKTKAWEQLRNGEPINENFNYEKKKKFCRNSGMPMSVSIVFFFDRLCFDGFGRRI